MMQFDLRIFFRWVGEKPPASFLSSYSYDDDDDDDDANPPKKRW